MSDMETTLATRKAIDREKDRLIRAAAKNVRQLKGKEMKENQIRNVVNVASLTTSMEEVTNFIRYQIGRDSRRWGDVGKAIISDIETGVVKQALQEVVSVVPAADAVQARAELMELYLGYLNRCFTYADKTGDWENLASSIGLEPEAPTHV